MLFRVTELQCVIAEERKVIFELLILESTATYDTELHTRTPAILYTLTNYKNNSLVIGLHGPTPLMPKFPTGYQSQRYPTSQAYSLTPNLILSPLTFYIFQVAASYRLLHKYSARFLVYPNDRASVPDILYFKYFSSPPTHPVLFRGPHRLLSEEYWGALSRREKKGRGVQLTTHHLLVSRLRTRGAILPLTHASSCRGDQIS
jgi:hypothetical protein